MTHDLSRALRWYRRLLRLYPRRFREVYGAELEQTFRLHFRRSGEHAVRFWVGTVFDALANAILMRLRPALPRPRLPPDTTSRRFHVATFWHDLRFAGRTLRRQPVFALVVVVTLSLGIGATTAIFTLVNGVLLAPLPFPAANELVRIWEHDTNEGRVRGNLSPADFRDYRQQNSTLAAIGAFGETTASWAEDGGVERLPAQIVTPGVFEILGVPPLLGRTFRPGDELEEMLSVVVAYGMWQSRLGGDSTVIGRTVQFGTRSAVVLGVMPATFRGPTGRLVDVWIPWNLADDERRAVHFIRAVGRVRPGVSVAAARNDLLGIARRLEQEYPEINRGHLVTVEPMTDAIVGDVRAGLWLLMGAVGAVLIIACANLANLFIARGIARGRELALRTALGAGRGRLVAQLLSESAVLAAAGGALGLLVAFLAVRAFVALDPGTVPRADQIHVDPAVALFTVSVVIVTALVFGGGPAILTTRLRPADALRAGGRGTGSPVMGRGLRNTLVVTQLALAVVLLLGAGLLIRSFDRLLNVDPGFDVSQVLSGRIELSGPRYDDQEDIVRFQDDLRDRLEREPSIQRVGTVTSLPLAGGGATAWLNVVGRAPWDGVPPEVNILNVSGDYFTAIGVSLLSGRLFDERDQLNAPRVTVINETMARTFWEGGEALGAQIRLGPNPNATPTTVIGIVSDMRQQGLGLDPFPAAFSLARQGAWSTFFVVMRVADDPAQAAAPLRRLVREIDPELGAYDVREMEHVVAASVARPRFSMLVLGVFALAALTIAAVGVYGVVAYSVAVRTHELGVRLALGASRGRMLRLVLSQAALLSGTAVVIGLGVGIAGSSVLRNMLFQIDPVDPITFAAMPLLLIGVALLAAYQPARRAVRLDPIRALRSE